jgi:hypothetical protein
MRKLCINIATCIANAELMHRQGLLNDARVIINLQLLLTSTYKERIPWKMGVIRSYQNLFHFNKEYHIPKYFAGMTIKC